MPGTSPPAKGKRRSVNLTIREDIMNSAKSLDLNVSRAAEAGIVEAIRQAHAATWKRENRAAIEAHNARVESGGMLLTPDWAAEE
ncbi:MAG: type II toxin-antitoxin system CcdA family antitoxin [Wenzhouxiangellaceae bacterium]